MKKRMYLWGVALVILSIVLVISTTFIKAGGALQFVGEPAPTDLPSDMATYIAQTRMAPSEMPNLPATPMVPNQITQMTQPPQMLNESPTHPWQELYPILGAMPSAEQVLAGKLEGKLAGYGMLMSDEPPLFLHGDEAGAYALKNPTWRETTYNSFIGVWAGHMTKLPNQGIVLVGIIPHYEHYQKVVVVKSPVQAGHLTIVGAVGERLILKSDAGETFYFDVPGLSFVNTLDEIISAATPFPTETLPAPLVPKDDAPDIPADARTYQPENTNLDFYISSPDDYDWFTFYSRASGPLTVSLIPRGGNYGLRVVAIDENQSKKFMEEDTTTGGGKKQVVLPDAPSGTYVVRVWSLDGTYNNSLPYTLLFEPAQPEKVTPMLECVAENADGTFTAHFGYDNPNDFVVVVSANHDNSFHPAPVFRTGQPEGFAPGRVKDWFAVLFDGTGLTWTLDGHAVTANRNSPRCP